MGFKAREAKWAGWARNCVIAEAIWGGGGFGGRACLRGGLE